MIFITWTKCPSKKWASIIQSSHRLLLCSAHSYSTETMCSPEWQAHEFKISKEKYAFKMRIILYQISLCFCFTFSHTPKTCDNVRSYTFLKYDF